jgi:sugar (pentulose or hexulose) kinase
MNPPYFLGIDIGTQGARIILIDSRGQVIASSQENFPLSTQSREEQSPQLWWQACLNCLRQVITTVKGRVSPAEILSASVTSTSGTVIPLDRDNEPLHNALMYSDQRSDKQGALCRQIALEFNNQGYTGFNSSSGLSKILWFVNTFPEKAERINLWSHAADYITGKLSGAWGISDQTNVLKSGYDLHKDEWPDYLFRNLPLERKWFPKVVASGVFIGSVEPSLAKYLGLDSAMQIVAGMTDGCASQVASGAVKPGDWNTTIGTTMVIKGVTVQEIKDNENRLYSHRHPEGFWMPGGAANIGADWIVNDFGEDIVTLNESAEKIIPTSSFVYPLRAAGERFPFIAPQARGFEPHGLSKLERFTAGMEGVGYIERYAYELIAKLGGEDIENVFTAGGGSNSEVWLRIRSNILNLPIYKMKNVTGAVGAAILAASTTHFKTITEATRAMTQIEKQIFPEKDLAEKYDAYYRKFVKTLMEKGYINEELYA